MLFAPAIGTFLNGNLSGGAPISKTAIAVVGGPTLDAGLILLNRQDPNTLDLRGTGSNPARITVTGGGVQVNSDDPNAVNWSGSPIINAPGVYIGSGQTNASSIVSGTLTVDAPPIPDPYATLAPPAQPALPSNPNPNNALKPGYYPKNSWPKNADVKLTGGIYYIDGGIDTTSNIDATAGVLLFFNTGSLVMRGNSALTIKPMTTGTYAGISIYQARGNATTATIRGSETADSAGAMYFPSATVTMWGTPKTVASQLIADKLDMRGTGTLNINYTGGVKIPGHKIWLVQ